MPCCRVNKSVVKLINSIIADTDIMIKELKCDQIIIFLINNYKV